MCKHHPELLPNSTTWPRNSKTLERSPGDQNHYVSPSCHSSDVMRQTPVYSPASQEAEPDSTHRMVQSDPNFNTQQPPRRKKRQGSEALLPMPEALLGGRGLQSLPNFPAKSRIHIYKGQLSHSCQPPFAFPIMRPSAKHLPLWWEAVWVIIQQKYQTLAQESGKDRSEQNHQPRATRLSATWENRGIRVLEPVTEQS